MEKVLDTNYLKVPSEWLSIWKLKVPPKVRNCIWRVCKNVLPTRVRSQDKGVSCPMQCVNCEGEMENSVHLFFTCRLSEDSWRKVGLWAHVESKLLQGDSFREIFFSISQTCQLLMVLPLQ